MAYSQLGHVPQGKHSPPKLSVITNCKTRHQPYLCHLSYLRNPWTSCNSGSASTSPGLGNASDTYFRLIQNKFTHAILHNAIPDVQPAYIGRDASEDRAAHRSCVDEASLNLTTTMLNNYMWDPSLLYYPSRRLRKKLEPEVNRLQAHNEYSITAQRLAEIDEEILLAETHEDKQHAKIHRFIMLSNIRSPVSELDQEKLDFLEEVEKEMQSHGLTCGDLENLQISVALAEKEIERENKSVEKGYDSTDDSEFDDATDHFARPHDNDSMYENPMYHSERPTQNTWVATPSTSPSSSPQINQLKMDQVPSWIRQSLSFSGTNFPSMEDIWDEMDLQLASSPSKTTFSWATSKVTTPPDTAPLVHKSLHLAVLNRSQDMLQEFKTHLANCMHLVSCRREQERHDAGVRNISEQIKIIQHERRSTGELRLMISVCSLLMGLKMRGFEVDPATPWHMYHPDGRHERYRFSDALEDALEFNTSKYSWRRYRRTLCELQCDGTYGAIWKAAPEELRTKYWCPSEVQEYEYILHEHGEPSASVFAANIQKSLLLLLVESAVQKSWLPTFMSLRSGRVAMGDLLQHGAHVRACEALWSLNWNVQ